MEDQAGRITPDSNTASGFMHGSTSLHADNRRVNFKSRLVSAAEHASNGVNHQQSSRGNPLRWSGGSGHATTRSPAPFPGPQQADSPSNSRPPSRGNRDALAQSAESLPDSPSTRVLQQLRTSRDNAMHKLQSQLEQRKAQARQAQVHFIGEITGASGFKHRSLYCRWRLLADNPGWALVKGRHAGCTQVSGPELPEDGMTVWEHPLDIQLSTHSIQRWPALLLKVYHRAVYVGQDAFVGYALCPLPTTPGLHHLTCDVWAVEDTERSFAQQLKGWLTGHQPQLTDEAFLTDLDQRFEMGQRLAARGAGGRVHLRLQLLSKDLDQVVHSGGESLFRALQQLHSSAEFMRKRAVNKAAALEEYRAEEESEGLRLVRQGREARFSSAQARLLDSRRPGDQQGSTPEAHSENSSAASSPQSRRLSPNRWRTASAGDGAQQGRALVDEQAGSLSSSGQFGGSNPFAAAQVLYPGEEGGAAGTGTARGAGGLASSPTRHSSSLQQQEQQQQQGGSVRRSLFTSSRRSASAEGEPGSVAGDGSLMSLAAASRSQRQSSEVEMLQQHQGADVSNSLELAATTSYHYSAAAASRPLHSQQQQQQQQQRQSWFAQQDQHTGAGGGYAADQAMENPLYGRSMTPSPEPAFDAGSSQAQQQPRQYRTLSLGEAPGDYAAAGGAAAVGGDVGSVSPAAARMMQRMRSRNSSMGP